MSDDLTTGLRELAEEGQAPPPVPGAEIRRRAGARRRRRRTAAAVGGASAAVALTLLLSLTGGEPDRRPAPPAASPTSTPSTRAAPEATVHLDRLVLVTGDRVLPVTAGAHRNPTPTGRMTVVGRQEIKMMSSRQLGLKESYDYKVPWVITARAEDGTAVLLGGLTFDDKAPGNYAITSGWIGLRPTDAKWLYQRLGPGDVIDIEGRVPTAVSDSVPTPERTAGASTTPAVSAGVG